MLWLRAEGRGFETRGLAPESVAKEGKVVIGIEPPRGPI